MNYNNFIMRSQELKQFEEKQEKQKELKIEIKLSENKETKESEV